MKELNKMSIPVNSICVPCGHDTPNQKQQETPEEKVNKNQYTLSPNVLVCYKICESKYIKSNFRQNHRANNLSILVCI